MTETVSILSNKVEVLAQTVTDNCKTMEALLQEEPIEGDIKSVQSKLLRLSTMIALSAKTKAYAEQLLEMKHLSVLKEYKHFEYPASIIQKFIKAESYEQVGLATWADRLNAGIVHSIDALRTIVSLYKEAARKAS